MGRLYAARIIASISLSQLVSGFHLSQIWATKLRHCARSAENRRPTSRVRRESVRATDPLARSLDAQEVQEKCLGEIRGLHRRMAVTSDVRVEGPPVDLAQLRQRLVRDRSSPAATTIKLQRVVLNARTCGSQLRIIALRKTSASVHPSPEMDNASKQAERLFLELNLLTESDLPERAA